MKRNRKGASKQRETINPWTYAQARAALPYLNSILRSMREHILDLARHQAEVKRLDRRPGRPDRDTLIAREEAARESEQAQGRFQAALDELQALDVYSLNPVSGNALVPFVDEEQLAWFVYDLFDPQPLCFWRYHSDPMETRRPITHAQRGPAQETGSRA